MEMIPTRMAEHVKVQTMLLKREDLTYDKLRGFIVDYCQSVAPLQPTPMDVGSFQPLTSSDYSWGYLQKVDPVEPEPLDSFGKAAKGAGVGKGQGGAGDKGGDPKCNICGRQGTSGRAAGTRMRRMPVAGPKGTLQQQRARPEKEIVKGKASAERTASSTARAAP